MQRSQRTSLNQIFEICNYMTFVGRRKAETQQKKSLWYKWNVFVCVSECVYMFCVRNGTNKSCCDHILNSKPGFLKKRVPYGSLWPQTEEKIMVHRWRELWPTLFLLYCLYIIHQRPFGRRRGEDWSAICILVPMSPGKDEEICSSSLFSKMLDSTAGSP